ncbi:sigma factor-like helix-turn-helix DNA-binding protein [Bacillus sp. Cs-700]|uniref:sigma factor-like helix-turn-helix DNA-binding protein n=1 Tax=Bacillus sp. Cs-700 TaxID=2589818 RepID=UPI0014093B1B|nr:sigma factor-like helix-turn-helix DNA-binding protein [Bacillus sp. Cs-700]
MHTEIDDEYCDQKQLEEMITKLYHYCYHLTQNKWDGEEIAQETIYKALKHYRNEKWSNALLKKMAYHQWVDRIRKRDKENLFSEIDLQDDATADKECCSEWLEKLLKQLTPKQFITFVLKEAFQYKISEIAVLLNMSDTGVKALLSRSRIKVRKLPDTEMNSFWYENMHESLLHTIVHSIHTQNPSELIKMLPILLNPKVSSFKTTYASPPSVLSLAA